MHQIALERLNENARLLRGTIMGNGTVIFLQDLFSNSMIPESPWISLIHMVWKKN